MTTPGPSVHAYILVQTQVGMAAAVASRIAEIPGVTTAEDVTGPYDVIVRADASSMDELGKLVVAKVQGAGMRCVSYTVNEAKDVERLMALGTDGIITDRVERFSPA